MKYSLTKHYKYKLEENYLRETNITGFTFDTPYYSMLDDGKFLVKKSYTWDGSSVPHKKLIRVLSLWTYNPDRHCKIASLIHDALCQAMREGLLLARYKLQADMLYQDMCLEGGMGGKQAMKRYWALRKFGNSGIEPEENPRNKIYDTGKEGK